MGQGPQAGTPRVSRLESGAQGGERCLAEADSAGDSGLCNLQQSIITKGLSGTPPCQAQRGLLIEETVQMHREAPSIRAAALRQLEKNHYSAAINGLCAALECMHSIYLLPPP